MKETEWGEEGAGRRAGMLAFRVYFLSFSCLIASPYVPGDRFFASCVCACVRVCCDLLSSKTTVVLSLPFFYLPPP
jgi:hypothetical protein